MKICQPTDLEHFRDAAVGPIRLRMVGDDLGLLWDILECPEADQIAALVWLYRGEEDPSAIVDLLPPGLVELEVYFSKFHELDFLTQALRQCPKLHKLPAVGGHGRDDCASNFFRALARSSLTNLVVLESNASTFGRALGGYLRLDRLQRLELRRLCDMSVNDSLFDCTRLEELQYLYCTFDRLLAVPPSLHTLGLWGCRFRPDETFAGLNNVRDLAITVTDPDPNLGPTLVALLETRGLARLRLSGRGHDVLSHIGGERLGRVRALELGWWGETPATLRVALTSPGNRVRDLKVCSMDVADLCDLWDILANADCRVQKLTIQPYMGVDVVACGEMSARFDHTISLLTLVQGQQLRRSRSLLRQLPVEMVRLAGLFLV